VFAPLARADQRVKGSLYLRGLLLDGRRRPMQPMAGRLGVDHQQSQQFMTSSAWQVDTVRTRPARRAVVVVRPQVRVVYDTGFPKGGTASPGVSRQHSGTLGKVGNCQIGGREVGVDDGRLGKVRSSRFGAARDLLTALGKVLSVLTGRFVLARTAGCSRLASYSGQARAHVHGPWWFSARGHVLPDGKG
jgi:hypothetical protein